MIKTHFVRVLSALIAASALATACGDDDDDGSVATGGVANRGGASSGGASTGGANSGGRTGGTSSGGSATGGASNGGSSTGGIVGVSGGGAGGAGGAGGENSGGDSGAAGEGPAGGGGDGPGGAGGVGGAGGAGGAHYTASQIARGAYLVRSVALCGGCHTATGGGELGGNAAFKGGTLPASNLTPDATGIGEWTDDQIITAFRDGIDDEGRHLNSAMPYWLFHNMSDDDALAIVAFLRSLTPVANEVGAANPEATPVTPLTPASLPNTTLPSSDANYVAAQQGKYLLSGVAQCVKCHSPSAAGLPTAQYFSGVAQASLPASAIFASNITPDATGIASWTAADVANALTLGVDKNNRVLCGAMPSAAKGYGGLTDADANAIGVYLTTITGVANANAAPTGEPACP
ncbi:MAG TPA: c-type cytochrome [Polyangiaceae bacterium]|jgi:cytochrome c553|nr:c-type cytochrome [Polyangiaceae bacterium]